MVFKFIFLLKREKKEMGLYSVLGIKKKSIAAMMFYETMTMGIIALVIGIFFRSFFSLKGLY